MDNPVGAKNEITITVTNDLTALAVGSGNVEVYATPMMLALMEECAAKLCERYIGEGQTTVGSYIGSTHVNATPVGMRVRAQATITAYDGRTFILDVKAFDEEGVIGEGDHKRVTVDHNKFQSRADAKLDPDTIRG